MVCLALASQHALYFPYTHATVLLLKLLNFVWLMFAISYYDISVFLHTVMSVSLLVAFTILHFPNLGVVEKIKIL